MNELDQHYCRSCGLKLDAIVADLAEQDPSPEYAELLKRKRRFEMFGMFSLSIAGVIGLMLIVSVAFYYKLILLGPEVLFGSAFAAIVFFGLVSVFFFNYPKVFGKSGKLGLGSFTSAAEKELSVVTGKLLDESRTEPASVTEHSTDLLPVSRKQHD